jgi:hypothetical protein
MQPFKSILLPKPPARSSPRRPGRGARQRDLRHARAIERLVGEIDAGSVRLAAGSLTLVPVANPLAYANARRIGDRNLNRKLTPTDRPVDHEDHVANWLCPLLAAHEVLLDLHSFQSPGIPFVLIGPKDNDGPLEPFAKPRREEALARPPRRRARRRRLARHLRGRSSRAAVRSLLRCRPRRSISTRATASAPPSTCGRPAAAR